MLERIISDDGRDLVHDDGRTIVADWEYAHPGVVGVLLGDLTLYPALDSHNAQTVRLFPALETDDRATIRRVD